MQGSGHRFLSSVVPTQQVGSVGPSCTHPGPMACAAIDPWRVHAYKGSHCGFRCCQVAYLKVAD